MAYLRVGFREDECQVGLVLGKAKLSPQPEPTIPRLELCGAVLAVEMADLILEELDHKPDAVTFYCDSKVVLGYIFNDSKRFYECVHNRVQRIRQTTSPQQWRYVPTDQNPADLATRSVSASKLTNTMWFSGPAFLRKSPHPEERETFELVDPELDAEVRPQVTTLHTQTKEQQPASASERYQRFSTWASLLNAVAFLIHQARSHKSGSADSCKEWHKCNRPRTPDELEAAKKVIFRAVQKDAYPKEVVGLEKEGVIPKTSTLLNLDPCMDDGLMRIGGRLRHSPLNPEVKHPIILPKKSHVTTLVVRHYHAKVKHQGQHFSEGAIRAAGLWIVSGKKVISSVLHHCVTCRKLRGKMVEQKMSDLRPERMSTSPPFSFVGLDVFGPWTVATRRTRGGAAQSKQWAILFTCMSTRAVHIKVIDSMDTASCINALRRFFAVRRPAKELRSDRGTNFIGASGELGTRDDEKHQSSVLKYLHNNSCTWEFNPPHASNMRGTWERMIGVSQRILDSMLLQIRGAPLTHDVLCTLMAEVSAIINARPLAPISSDPSSPFLLTPAMLLTQKQGLPAPPGDITDKDLFKSQWNQVQALANEFWTRWREEYLSTLQPRRKWFTVHHNLQAGDIMLLKDNLKDSPLEWPMGLVTSTFPSSNGKVRKIEVRIPTQDTVKAFLRPVSEVILLLPKEN